jgi:hypothetical protein
MAPILVSAPDNAQDEQERRQCYKGGNGDHAVTLMERGMSEELEYLKGEVGALHDAVTSMLTALSEHGNEAMFRAILVNLTTCERMARERNEHSSRIEALASLRAAFDEF